MQETQVRSLGGEDPWGRKWQPTPIFLPGKSHGQRSLAGYSPWGLKESDTTEHAHTPMLKSQYNDFLLDRLVVNSLILGCGLRECVLSASVLVWRSFLGSLLRAEFNWGRKLEHSERGERRDGKDKGVALTRCRHRQWVLDMGHFSGYCFTASRASKVYPWTLRKTTKQWMDHLLESVWPQLSLRLEASCVNACV